MSTAQVRQKLPVPTTALAQGAGYQGGPGTKPGTARWAGASRASTLDGAAWLEAHPDLARPHLAPGSLVRGLGLCQDRMRSNIA
jgi:hypothetical protein